MKYNIDKELKKLRNFIPPVNRFVISIASIFLRVVYKKIDKKKIKIEYYKMGHIKYHIITPINLIHQITPCFMFIHGGGFIFRAYPAHFVAEQKYAINANCRVVGIDYDLAPKYKYPIALNECVDVYNEIINKHKLYKIDVNKIIIGGGSAGGLLALDTCFHIKDNKIQPKGVLLTYPVVDNKMDTDSMKRFVDTPCWNAKLNEKMWNYYLGNQKYVSPLDKISDFNIKNYYIELCEFDALHDEGYILFQKLKENGNNVILNDTKGTFHGCDVNFKAKIIIDSYEKRIKFLENVFEN